MFYPERMKRARFLVHGSMKEKAVKRFHELGALQVTDFREKLSKEEWKDLLVTHPASSDVRRITTQLMAVNRTLDVFPWWCRKWKRVFQDAFCTGASGKDICRGYLR